MRRLAIVSLIIMLVQTTQAGQLQLTDLQIQQTIDSAYSSAIRTPSSQAQTGIMTTKNLAWSTLVLLGATALTGREQKVHPVHIGLAGLSGISYGMFLNSYLNDDDAKGKDYKYAKYSQWFHIPAMFILPIAGAMAMRDFDNGEEKAQGFGALHKPAALASIIGMSLATFSLTFKF